ncbi:hypothetical protein [Nocardia sp. CC227C]|uniref:hypothetical protein n=1 Tax=Nocardia sp. CC227C TaxID=3044562 RepID=UPI00278C41B6|nr:hypothetical protein [Nocardia sp. CC227C]
MPIRVRHNIAGYYALRSEPGVVADLEARGQRVLAAAGGEAAGYGMDSRQGAKRPQGRWRVSVVTNTPEAMLDNAENNTLLRAMGAAR